MKHNCSCHLVLLGYEKEETNNLTTGEIIMELQKKISQIVRVGKLSYLLVSNKPHTSA